MKRYVAAVVGWLPDLPIFYKILVALVINVSGAKSAAPLGRYVFLDAILVG